MERDLTGQERRVLDAMLAFDFPGSYALREQASAVKVVGGCDCGCATVHLEVAEGAAPPCPDYRPIPVDATVRDQNGNTIGGIIVFVDDGYLSNLEIYSFLDDPIREFPPLDQIHLSLST